MTLLKEVESQSKGVWSCGATRTAAISLFIFICMEVGNLVRHIYWGERVSGNGIIIEKKQNTGERIYYKIKWMGGGQSDFDQWFPEK